MNTAYRSLMKLPHTMVLLELPEHYQKADFAEYLEDGIIYVDCQQVESADALYRAIRQALHHKQVLCLDHLNHLVRQPFWETVSQMMLFLLRQEDYVWQKEELPLSQMRLLLPHSDSEINDTSLDVNLLEWSCRCAIMLGKNLPQ